MPPSPSKPKANEPNSYRQQSEIYGRHGETLAAWYLRLKGYRILKTRYKTPVGEIDLIARRFGTTVFVEVKSRNRSELEREALGGMRAEGLDPDAVAQLSDRGVLVESTEERTSR